MPMPTRLDRRTLVVAAAVLAALTGLALVALDGAVARAVDAHGRPLRGLWTAFVTAAEYLVGYPIHKLFVVFAVGAAAAVALVVPAWRGAARSLAFVALTHLVTRYATGLCKPVFGRVRPFQADGEGALHTFWVDGHAFPSGHTAHFLGLALAVAVVVPMQRSTRATLLLLPALVGLGRIGTNDHYLSDVLGAAALTCAVTALMAWAFRYGKPGD